MNFLEKIWRLFETPLFELTMIEVAVAAGLLVLAFFVLKFLVKWVKHIFRFIKMAFSAKQKCKKIQCTTCGRTLDRCACQKNKDRGYVSRLYNYKKEQKLRKDR